MTPVPEAVVPKTTPPPSGWRGRKLLRWLERMLAVIGLFFIIYHLGFELTVMTSESMAPTLKGSNSDNGDRILVEKVSGWFRNPRRWEVYFLYDAEGTAVAKRIVGLPGERISIKDNHLLVNGIQVPMPQGFHSQKYYPVGNLARGNEVECGEGFFVLGDDSQDSYDSRYLGPVLKKQFKGRVWCILSPSSRRGFVK
jgi:signal peptidase I